MIQNLISMNGYGLFVWASFSITFLVCALVYLRTYKTLKKYEREFAKEINQLSFEQKKNSCRKFKNRFTSFIVV